METTVCHAPPRNIERSHLPFFPDVLLNEGERLVLILRDHKTSRPAGLQKCILADPVRAMFVYWMQTGRALALGTRANHNRVFLNVNTGNPFDQQGFSKFMGRSFMKVTGQELNLQTVRRMFAEGAL